MLRATAKVLRRDLSLGKAQVPESLQRPRQAVDQVISEKQTLDDLKAVKSRAESEQRA